MRLRRKILIRARDAPILKGAHLDKARVQPRTGNAVMFVVVALLGVMQNVLNDAQRIYTPHFLIALRNGAILTPSSES